MFPGFLVPGFLEVYLTAVSRRCHRKKQKGKHEKANFKLISITRKHTALAYILLLFLFFLIFEISYELEIADSLKQHVILSRRLNYFFPWEFYENNSASGHITGG